MFYKIEKCITVKTKIFYTWDRCKHCFKFGGKGADAGPTGIVC